MINPFGKKFSVRETELFDFLRRINLFSELTNKELIHFIPYLFERQYNENEVVFFSNDPSHALYIIRSGTVSLNVDINDQTEILTEISSNEMFGINCLVKGSFRRSNAIVSSETAKMYVIPVDSLFKIMDDHTDIKVKLLTQLSYYYEQTLSKLFRNYQTSFGLFNLGDIYKKG